MDQVQGPREGQDRNQGPGRFQSQVGSLRGNMALDLNEVDALVH